MSLIRKHVAVLQAWACLALVRWAVAAHMHVFLINLSPLAFVKMTYAIRENAMTFGSCPTYRLDRND